jgi:LPS sulfotransferase NodH
LRPIRFVILAAPRTGSNMLCTLLGSHADILCHHELFNPADVYCALELRGGSLDLGGVGERDRDPLAFLERVWSAHLGHSHVGFKMTHRQNQVALDAVLRDSDVRKIVLRRENRVRTFVSRLIAEKTGQWEVYREADLAPERPRVHVDVAALHQSAADDEDYYREIEGYLRATGQPSLRVCYERILGGGERARLLEFLRIPDAARAAATLSVRSINQNPAELCDLIANFTELEAALTGTALAADLEGS